MAVKRQDEVLATGVATVPGPKGAPLLGSALDLKRDILGFMLTSMLEYGDLVRAVVGPPPIRTIVYFAFHPDYVQQVLAGNADDYYKGTPVYEEINELLGEGLLTSDGDVWKRQKRLVQPLFTHKRVGGYVPMMSAEASAVVEAWSAPARAGEAVDLHEEMTKLTLRIVGRAVFGTEVDHMIPILRATVPYLSGRALKRGLSPVRIPNTWPTPANRHAARDRAALYGIVDDLITSRRRSATEGEDLVNLLLGAQDPEGGTGMSDSEVRDQALVFLLAGHETTSTALTFALHLLGHHPEIQQRAHEEAVAVLGDRQPSLEDVRALDYTTMVLKEAMRLYPSATAVGRSNRVEDVIGGYRIPANSAVIVSQWATHRHPRFWDNPYAFDPERFTPEREKARHRYAYFPFGGGPRACIGQYFSMLEAVIVLAEILQEFRITTSPEPVPLFTGITMRPARAMPAQVESRT